MRANLATLVDEFRAHAAETAVVAHRGNRRYRTSYGELAEMAGRFAAELERRGVGPGERVVIWGENSAEWVGVFFGCVLRAVIAVPLDAAGSAEFAARVIADTKPRLVVGDGGLLAALALYGVRSTWYVPKSGPGLSSTDNVERSTDNIPTMELRGIGERLGGEPLWAVSEAVGPHTPFQIVFTSGTTSEPRGIVHTHRNILVTLEPIENEIAKYRKYERVFHPLRFLHSLPLSHVFGQFMGLWCPALLAAEVHFTTQHEPSRIAETIKRERISVLIAVPRVLGLLRGFLLERFPEADRSTLYVDRSTLEAGAAAYSTENVERTTDNGKAGGVATILRKWWRYRRVHRALGWKFWAVISGGATLPAELEAFWNRMGYALIQGYGMTETAALVTLNHPFHIKEGTIGKPMPGHEVKLTDEGEILVRGEMLTEATWQGGAMHKREGEWLATGDLAETSASGELKFLGRKGDVIVTSAGLNIHPGDLEAALAGQAGVRAAAVVACDGNAGPEPVAVVLFAGTDAELGAAVSAANRELAEFQQIRRVLRWPELEFPYTSTGKLVRRRVAEWACGVVGTKNRSASGTGSNPMVALHFVQGEHGAPGFGAGDELLRLIAEVTGEPVAAAAGDGNGLRLSEDLHLDSLGRVQLQSALEQRFALELEDDAIATVGTVGELRELVGGGVVRSTLPADRSTFYVDRSTLPVDRAQAGSRDGVAIDEGQADANVESAAAPQRTTDNVERTTDHMYPRWPWAWPVRAVRVVWIEAVMRPLVWLLAKPKVRYVGRREEKAKANTGVLRSAQNDKLIVAQNDKRGEGAVWSDKRGEGVTPWSTPSNMGHPAVSQLTTCNLQPATPMLIVCNHVTAFDGALVLYALPGRVRRRVAAAMSGEMLLEYRAMRGQGNWLLNLLAPAAYWLLTALFNVFPLPRARGFRRSFAHAGEAMDRGYSVLIFPEGSRSRDGKMHAFRPGIGLLAEESRVGILPVALVGMYEPGRWFHAGRIEVRVGEVIPAAGDASDAAEMTRRLEDAVRGLLG